MMKHRNLHRRVDRAARARLSTDQLAALRALADLRIWVASGYTTLPEDNAIGEEDSRLTVFTDVGRELLREASLAPLLERRLGPHQLTETDLLDALGRTLAAWSVATDPTFHDPADPDFVPGPERVADARLPATWREFSEALERVRADLIKQCEALDFEMPDATWM